jgi:2-keto-4-pentenoate hydratase/2-oxohepta-3-ene-1,7-dioic acid hydratase in catechol pathway
MVFGVPRLIAELAAVLPLLPGDVIFTGTPAGIGATRKPPRFLRPGDVVESAIEGIGTIRNRCIAKP